MIVTAFWLSAAAPTSPAIAVAPPTPGSWVFPVDMKIEPLPVRGRWTTHADDQRCGEAAWTRTVRGSAGLWAVHPTASNDYFLTVYRPLDLVLSADPGRPQVRLNAATLHRPIEVQAFANRYVAESLQGLTLKIDRDQMAAVLAARSLAFDVEGAPSFRVEIDGKGSPAPLDQCEHDGLIAAGLDPALPAQLLKWPSFTTPAWSLFSNDDYPAAAMAAGAQGTVRAQLSVDATGQAEGCRVVKSSGSALLDTHTCEILLRRARLDPALDKAGKPVAAPAITTVSWKLSE